MYICKSKECRYCNTNDCSHSVPHVCIDQCWKPMLCYVSENKLIKKPVCSLCGLEFKFDDDLFKV